MSFKLPLHPIHHPGGGPGTPGVKPWSTLLTLQAVGGVDPVVDQVDFLTPVPVTRWRWSVVRKPHHLGRIKEGRNCKLIREVRVVLTLVENILFKPPERPLERVKVASL